MKRYRRIGITVKSAFDRKDEALIRVLRTLKKEGCTVCVDSPRLAGIAAARGCPPICEQKNIDLLIVLGGDGTVLRSLRELKNILQSTGEYSAPPGCRRRRSGRSPFTSRVGSRTFRSGR